RSAARLGLRRRPVDRVRAVVAGGEQTRRPEMELLGDVAAGRTVCGRRQRHQRRIGKALLEDAERLVVTPEIMAPLRDAVRLVDREQREMATPAQLQAAR